jgi:flagellar secretion chaperone FliS
VIETALVSAAAIADDIAEMTANANITQEYLRSAVLTASPEQLQLMLLDGAIRYADRGRQAIQTQNIEGAFNALERAQRCVLELNNGLCREINPPLVDQMAALYSFIYRRLVDANMHHDQRAAEEALRILRHQRETWALLVEKITRETAPARGGPVKTAQVSGSEFEAGSLSLEG